jgi:cytochrome c6
MAQQAGEATFKAKCAMCHGADGLGNTPVGKNMKVRSFKSPEDIKATDAELFKQTKDGVGKMQGYANKLTDAQIQDVVTYIRTLQK